MFIPMSCNFHDSGIQEGRIAPVVKTLSAELGSTPYLNLQDGALTVFFTWDGLAELSAVLTDALREHDEKAVPASVPVPVANNDDVPF